MNKPQNNGKTVERDSKGRFVKGHKKLGSGKPKGYISIKARITQYLKKNPEKLDELVSYYLNDKKMRELLWKMLDGMPSQQIEHSLDDKVEKINVEITQGKNGNKSKGN